MTILVCQARHPTVPHQRLQHDGLAADSAAPVTLPEAFCLMSGAAAARRTWPLGWRPLAAIIGSLVSCSCLVPVGSKLPPVPPGGYRLEHHGQDRKVLRNLDGAIVFNTGVEETSAGSDTDSDITGEEEFFQGCLWTWRQKLSMCLGGNCGEAELMAHDLQRRLQRWYDDRSNAPPLEDISWLVFGTNKEQRRELMTDCPGLIVTALFFAAESAAFANADLAHGLAAEAESYVYYLEQTSSAQLAMAFDMFPVQQAYAGQHHARQRLEDEATKARASQLTLDVVISRCGSSLQWLWDMELPPRSRIYVYDKCEKGEAEFQQQVAGLEGMVEELVWMPLSEPRGEEHLMLAECTAYLAHVVKGLAEGRTADYTLFVHDDGPRHVRVSYLNLALRGMLAGTYDVPFLHLVHERYPSFRTPCLEKVYREIFQEDLPGKLSTYCCGHFIVSKERISQRGQHFYERLKSVIERASYSQWGGGSCRTGRKPCYVIEFLWHKIFGEEDELPLRSEQPSLPMALRYEGGRFSRYPSALAVEPHVAPYQPARYSNALLKSAADASRTEL
eukprot:TRINITY_DN18723_c0_g1_i2.p1 TRINITY_DN18723_c0_g1~~TRINITY_DN18723_c0_g1_i2.p1  ORF type:complete len:560 (-),score=102.75 TRINITY_DN18723_c0_g1_i2:2-1681(-)